MKFYLGKVMSDQQPERKLDQAKEKKERSLDKTIADSFPTSDPPSTIPDPEPPREDESDNNK
jgi:hypothetical protein